MRYEDNDITALKEMIYGEYADEYAWDITSSRTLKNHNKELKDDNLELQAKNKVLKDKLNKHQIEKDLYDLKLEEAKSQINKPILVIIKERILREIKGL